VSGEILYRLVDILFQLYWWIIFIRVILSWLPMAGLHIDSYNPLIRLLYQLTDPILEPLRRYTTFGMMDFSPIVALLILDVLRRVILSVLLGSF
jgi:YggT family protein